MASGSKNVDGPQRQGSKQPGIKASPAVEVRVLQHKDAADGQRWAFKGREFLGSLVFFPASAEELTAAKEDANEFSPSKIGRLLAKRQAHDMEHALSTPELAVAMFPGELGNEKLVRRLEKLGRTALKAYCQDHDGVLWWYYEKLEGSA